MTARTLSVLAIMGALLFTSIARAAGQQGTRLLAVSRGELTSDRSKGPVGTGDLLYNGDRLTLNSGAAVIEFSDYGRMLIKGPAVFRLAAASIELEQGAAQFVFGSTQFGFLLNTNGISVGPPYGEPFTAYAETRPGGELFFCLCEGHANYGPAIPGKFSRPMPADRPHTAYLLRRSGPQSVSLTTFHEPKKAVAKTPTKTAAKKAADHKDDQPYHHDDASIARLR